MDALECSPKGGQVAEGEVLGGAAVNRSTRPAGGRLHVEVGAGLDEARDAVAAAT